MVKKSITVILLAVFLFCTVSPVMASVPQPRVSRDEALEIVKAKVDIPDKVRLNFVNYRYDYTGLQVWAFNWIGRDNREQVDISAEVDAMTGRLRSFNRYTPGSFGESRLTPEQAKAIALEYVKAMNPDEYGQLILEPVVQPNYGLMEKGEVGKFGPTEYYFKFNRIVNGYPFWDNGVNVTVSSADGSIVSYYYNWDSGDIAPVDSVVYRAVARKTLDEKIGFELAYFRVWDEGNPNGPAALGYYYSYPAPMYIDALTGAAVNPQGEAVANYRGSTPLATEAGQAPAGSLTTMDEAIAAARTWTDLPENYVLMSAMYSENHQADAPATWNLSWGDKKLGYANIGIYADTGELSSLDVSLNPTSSPRTEITQDQAALIAEDFLKRGLPTKAGQLRRDPNFIDTAQSGEKRPFYSFHFSRLVSGIPMVDGGADVTVNGEGKVTMMWSNWETLEFPPAEGIISAGDAARLMEKKLGFDLGYVRIYDSEGGWKTRLVYRANVDSGFYVDAKSGDVRPRWGGPLVPAQKLPEDLKGHWAEKDINKLAGSNIIIFGDGKFQPDQAASRAEITTMLARAVDLNPYFPEKPAFTDVPKEDKDYGYIEAAYKAGIIAGDNGRFDPAGEITREALALILVKSFNNLKSGQDFSLEQFKDAPDISEWARDGVLAAVRSGLFKGDTKGNFNPRGKVTRAEAAAVIARALDRQQD